MVSTPEEGDLKLAIYKEHNIINNNYNIRNILLDSTVI